jgi:hypothetical protein
MTGRTRPSWCACETGRRLWVAGRARGPSRSSVALHSSPVAARGRHGSLRPRVCSLQATKVAAHLQKTGAASGAPTFVWTKKIERDLEGGKTVRDIAAAQARVSQAERLVRPADTQP